MVKVLIVDDYLSFRDALKDFLETVDPAIKVVAEACNGKEALRKLEKVEVDVALIDIRMPLMDGIETTRVIRQRWGDSLGVITYTGFNSSRLARRARQAGADRHLVKPFELFALRKAVLQLAANYRPAKAISVG